MIHEPRGGFLLASLLINVPTTLIWWVYAGSQIDCNGYSCGSQTASLIAFGGLEAIGVACLIVGIVGHDVPVGATPQGRNVALLPFLTPEAQGISMRMRW
jgi:hypothetical protein